MTKDERIDEAFRVFMTGVAYLAGGFFCLAFSFLHMGKDNMGWATTFWLLTLGLLAMAAMAKNESMRIMPEPRDDDD